MNAKLLILAPLMALSLVACGGNGSSSTPGSSSSNDGVEVTIPELPVGTEKAQKALASLSHKTHGAHIEMATDVYRDNPLEVGIHQGKTYDIVHQYGAVRAYTEKYSYNAYDYKGTDKVESTEWGYSDPKAYYFRDEETGLAIKESITIDNEVNSSYLSDYNDTTGVYLPYAFDSLFRNPWDYIRASDIVEEEDGSLHLQGAKAQFVVTCYGGTSINYVDDIALNLGDDGGIDSLSFEISEIREEGRYTRTNEFSVTYDRGLGEQPVPHLQPYSNDNPDLSAALKCLDGVDSYTYNKEFLSSWDGERTTWTTGYFIRDDMAYYAQRSTPGDEHPYQGGDDYDYKAVYDPSDKLYHVYQYDYGDLGWDWHVVTLSSSTAYTIDSFEGLGPDFSSINPALFKKTGERTYEAEEMVVSGLGSYFDNGMLGVQSGALEGSTDRLVITLNEDKTAIATVLASFSIQGDEYYIRFTLSDINSTTLPSYAAE